MNKRMNDREMEKLDEILLFINKFFNELRSEYNIDEMHHYGINRPRFIRGMINEIYDKGYIDKDMWYRFCTRILDEKKLVPLGRRPVGYEGIN